MTTGQIYSIPEVLKGFSDDYALDLFTEEEVNSIEIFGKRGRPYLRCLVTDKDRPAKPEEIVRQLYLARLMKEYGYPKDRIYIEHAVYFGSAVAKKRADIVVTEEHDPDTAYIIVETKKPKRHDGLEQLKSYCNAEGSPIGVWTNGGEIVYLHREEPNLFKSLPDIPKVHQHLSELLEEQWDLERLTHENRLVRERLTLKSIILNMEDLVLANAGVDAFEEVFKLIYAKLYDEWNAARGGQRKRYLQFRISGSTPTEFYDKINNLFQRAKKQWPGVFLPGENIDLAPAHLVTCGSFLEDIKLFNSNLQIIDEAFEYLSIQIGKGSKGQYFTPRHVIDMCVKMLRPTIDEYVIDTAAGSCGFTVHTIFWVWGNQFLAQGPSEWQKEYARQNIYAIDFDARSVKIAKAINLIAGDGRTNVYRANTLDPRSWDDSIQVGLRDRLRRFRDPEQDAFNQKNFRYFSFDILMTNPPFAGDIKDTRILHQFDLAKKDKARWQSKVGRDVLFIERNLDFLRPGGRMCIVLPQGRFNNVSEEYIRRFIADRARILAVVGLDVNTFKPHTGTKTSILFIQKWNDEPEQGPLCPRVDNFPIFFATSQNSGKDNSGEYRYKKSDDGRPLLDKWGHMIVEHDLNEIAEGFVEFAIRQELSFYEET